MTAAIVARVGAEQLTALPDDLYIPPDALAVCLQSFEGPLDLLSWLIRRNRLDILDIPMAELTAQYMTYVEWMRYQRLELAAEYLVMAVWLMEIKSRMLLPAPAASQDEAEADPRTLLVRQLMEYEQIRNAAEWLTGLPLMGRDVFAANVWQELPEPDLPVADVRALADAWQALLRRGTLTVKHRAARRELSLRTAMTRLLSGLQGDLFLDFSSLFEAKRGVSWWVVHVLAMLELAREQRLEIVQNEPFAPIYVRERHAGT